MMKKLLILMLSLAAMFSCQKTYDKQWELTVDSRTYNVSYSDTSMFVTVWCSGSWRAELTEGASWMSLKKTSGTGISSLGMSFPRNEGLARKAVLRLSSAEQTLDVQIVQKSAIATPRIIFEKTQLSYCNSCWKVRASAQQANLREGW